MPPLTRSHPSEDYIIVSDSDEAPKTIRKSAAKRQKKGNMGNRLDRAMNVDVCVPAAAESVSKNEGLAKNAHLKGRRRFAADLADAIEEFGGGYVHQHAKINNIRKGEEEGSIEIELCHAVTGQHIVTASIIVTDTADYPREHSFFVYFQDSDLAPEIHQALEHVGSDSQSIRQTIQGLLHAIVGQKDAIQDYQDIVMDDEDDSDAYDTQISYDDFATQDDMDVEHKRDLQQLQTDFIEIVGHGYRPGFIPSGGDGFFISVSIPVINLAQYIPPRALMAWDSRLLDRLQHLTLLISGFRAVYPPLADDGTCSTIAQRYGTDLSFKIGLTAKYKPGKENAQDAIRIFSLIVHDAEDELLEAKKASEEDDLDFDDPDVQHPAEEELQEEEDEGRFDKFSLSSSLESLLNQAFSRVLQIRKKFDLGWAGAEMLLSYIEKGQKTDADVYGEMEQEILQADEDELKFARSKNLPQDPLSGIGQEGKINLPLVAFCYLLRRLSLCTRYCLVCHNKLNTGFEALKPYVCDSKLCAFRYYSLNHGPSLEYEIVHNPRTVDLLVSMAYCAAAEQALGEPLPVGMGLRVPYPQTNATISGVQDKDGLCDFDKLDLTLMRMSIVELINTLPPIDDMKKHLEKKVRPGKSKPKLKDTDPDILPAAWLVLRIVGSCTANLEEITSEEKGLRGIAPAWRQFRFSVGAPDAEAKFKEAVLDAQKQDANARKYPSLFAFHGSPMKNWHSIVRHGLWYKTVANGRAYGDGVYLAKDGNVSISSYSRPSGAVWKNSGIGPTNCAAVAEIVNLPRAFVSSAPHFVVKDTHWIICRYLLVRSASDEYRESSSKNKPSKVPFVNLDPKQPITLGTARIEIPEPSYELNMLLAARNQEYMEEDNDEDDVAIFQSGAFRPPLAEVEWDEDVDIIDEEDVIVVAHKPSDKVENRAIRSETDWQHDAEWVQRCVSNLMPPPSEASPSATMAVQRELKAMLKEQENAKSMKELGWFMPPELVGDNLFQWIVEMHSFDENIPIAKDLKQRKINSIVFEIRFPPAFPLSPPFFRIISPRFLPFIQGGGGHVTGGGSICMDLLTADGWLPSYSISAVLLQIKLAISNLDPRPARLAPDYDRQYSPKESLEGFKRAAAAHGWQVPVGIEKLVQ